MNRFWRAFNRWVQWIRKDSVFQKSTKGRRLHVKYYLLPVAFVGSYLIPNSFIQNVMKRRYGVESEAELSTVNAETWTLVQEVLEDIKELNIANRRLYGSMDLDIYSCKGNEIILHWLYDISSSRMLIGVPSNLSFSPQDQQSFHSVPQNGNGSSKVLPSSPSQPPPKQRASLTSADTTGRTPKLFPESLKDAPPKRNLSQIPTTQHGGEKPGGPDYVSDLSVGERKFVFLRHILLWTLHFQDKTSLLILFPVFTYVFINVNRKLIYLLLNSFSLYGFYTKYHTCSGYMISGKYHKQTLNMLMTNEARKLDSYVEGGRTYSMKKLRQNCDIYKFQQKKATDSLYEKLHLMTNIAFHRLLPNLDKVYNRAGCVRAWPSNYFNYDLFWAYNLKNEFTNVTEHTVGHDATHWKTWLLVHNENYVEDVFKYYVSELPNLKEYSGIPLIFKSVAKNSLYKYIH